MSNCADTIVSVIGKKRYSLEWYRFDQVLKCKLVSNHTEKTAINKGFVYVFVLMPTTATDQQLNCTPSSMLVALEDCTL